MRTVKEGFRNRNAALSPPNWQSRYVLRDEWVAPAKVRAEHRESQNTKVPFTV